jgi:peroxiredoxin
LVQLQSSLKEIETTGGHIVAISYDSTNVLKRFAAESKIAFPLLSDVGSKTIDAYGIRNKEVPEQVSGIPHPGTFIVGTNGIIRSKLFLDGYTERHGIDALIDALKKAK